MRLVKNGPAPRPILDRIADKFLVGDGCWDWIGASNPAGYGRFWVDGKNVYPHRVMYELMVGPIPEGMVIDHLCSNPSCVRPDHLEATTQSVNVRRGRGRWWREQEAAACA